MMDIIDNVKFAVDGKVFIGDVDQFVEIGTVAELKQIVAENEALKEQVNILAKLEEQGKRFFLKGGIEIARRYGQWALYDVSGSIVDHYDSLEKALSAHGRKGGVYESN